MKKLYFIISGLFSLTASNAQLTQANHATSAGDNFQMWQCDSVAPGSAGTGMNWNFSTLPTRTNITLSYSAGASSNTMFPSASVTLASSSTDLSYLSANSSSLSYYGGNISVGAGLTAVVASLNYTAAAVRAFYPMSLNTTTSAAIGGSITITAPIATSGTFTGMSTTLADGSGTLVLPGTTGTFTNVIRVVNSQTINFTTSFALAPTGTIVQRSYEFYMSGIKNPILSIATSTATLPLGAASQTLVLRDKNAVGIATASTTPINTTSIVQNEQAGLIVTVFPNPATNVVNFSTAYQLPATLMVYDITGKLVETVSLAGGKAKIDVSGYNKGLYIYSMLAEDGKKLKTGKLTVSE